MATPEQKEPTAADIENVKAALVSAGVLKARSISDEDQAKIQDALRKHGADTELRNSKVICSTAHWCIVIPKK